MEEYTSLEYGTIEYDGYMYKLFTDINTLAIKQICGEVECLQIDLFCRHGHIAKYHIEDGSLFLDELMICTDESNIPKLKKGIECERTIKKRRGAHYEAFGALQEYVCITYRNVDLLLHIDESLIAKQVYFDEHYNITKYNHNSESIFVFNNGVLDVEKSSVQKSIERRIDVYAWREEFSIKPDKDDAEIKLERERSYLFEPTGSIEQYSYVVSVIVNYLTHRRLERKLIAGLFDFPRPIFCIKVMRETKPNSYEYYLDTNTYDLIKSAVRFGDGNLLKRLFHYIDWNEYADLKPEILKLIK